MRAGWPWRTPSAGGHVIDSSRDAPTGGRGRGAVAALALLIALSGPWAPSTESGAETVADAATAPRFVPGRVLVRFRDGVAADARRRLVERVAAVRDRRYGRGLERLHVAPLEDVEEAARALAASPDVLWAEPDWIVRHHRAPDDPFYPQQFWLNNSGQVGGVPGADIGAEAAWNLTTGTREVVVAVIDSGIDYNHPDLAANVWTNPGEIPENGIDDDGNGYVDDVRGWDFVNDDNDPFDDNDHGTHVSGILGALGDNGRGVSGVAWKVTILPLKFTNAGGFGATSDAVEALDYALAQGVRVSNNSWGGSGFSQTLRDALRRAAAADHLFVAAAGNLARNLDVDPQYPAAYDDDVVLTVMATDDSDRATFFTNFGAESVDVAAAGERVLSTVVGGVYRQFNGTSMSAPQVTGAAALALALAPDAPAVALKQEILAAADPVPALTGGSRTGARLNVRALLERVEHTPPGGLEPLEVFDVGSTTARLRWTATGDDGAVGTAWRYQLRVADAPIETPIDATTFADAVPLAAPAPRPAGAVETFEVSGLAPDREQVLAIRAQDEWGNAGPIATVVVATLRAPVVDVAPTSLRPYADAGGVASATLTVANAGPGVLDWALAPPAIGPLVGRVTAEPAAGRLTAGAEASVAVAIDGTALADGLYTEVLTIASNDPVRPTVEVPLAVAFGSRPRLAVARAAEPLASEAAFDDTPSGTVQTLTFAAEPVGPLRLSVFVEGDFGEPGEFASVFVDGDPVAVVSGATQDCRRGGATFELPGRDVRRWAADGRIEVRVENSTSVATFCTRNVHELTVEYRVGADAIAFEPTVVGAAREATVDLLNVGEIPLQILDAVADRPDAFEATFETPFLTTDESTELAVRFAPQAAEALAASLTFVTNEPDDASTVLALAGVGLDPPIARIEPGSVALALAVGDRVDVPLTLANDGASPLTFEVAADGPLAIEPSAGTVAAGGSAPLTLRVDTASLVAGTPTFVATFALDDPQRPTVDLPVALTLSGTPRFELETGPIAVESVQRFATFGAVTTHRLPVSVPVFADPRIELVADGDFGLPSEVATLTVEGAELLSVSDAEFDCEPLGASVPVDPDALAAWLADGVVDAEVRNTVDVDLFCADNRHLVRLVYRTAPDRVEFGERFVDHVSVRDVLVHNTGSAPLTLTAVSVAGDAFGVGPYDPSVPPGGSVNLPVTFLPAAVGTFEGRLDVTTDDPARPSATLPLTGVGVAAPALRVSPDALAFATRLGERATRTLTLTNAGEGPLAFSATPVSGVPTGVVVAPAGGTLAPGATMEVEVSVDATDLDAGERAFAIAIDSDDPARPTLEVPVTWEVIGTPRLGLATELSDRVSNVPFVGVNAVTEHTIEVDVPAAGAVTVELEVRGDFGSLGENARLTVEGEFLFLLGGGGADCSAITRLATISVDRFARWIEDGRVEATVANSIPVGTICPDNYHRLSIRYPEAVDAIDLGRVFDDRETATGLRLYSTGNSELTIASLTVEGDGFEIDPAPGPLPPGTEVVRELRAAPTGPGLLEATLVVTSDDAVRPIVRLPLRAEAARPPRARLTPAVTTLVVDTGEPAEVALELANDGDFPLDWRRVVPGAAGPSLVALPSSPGPVACLVADPIDGSLYVQERRATRFHRLAPGASAWDALARSPMPAEEFCGAALIDGRVHVFHSSRTDAHAVYDIATGTWATRPHPTGSTVGAIAGDGDGAIYLARLRAFVRLDPATGAVERLADPPFNFERGGGLEVADGIVLGHRGNGNPGFARYSIADDAWTVLPDPPGGAVSGDTWDPVARAYWAVGARDLELLRYDATTNAWQAYGVPPELRLDLAELTWAAGPNPGVRIGQGRLGRTFARIADAASVLVPAATEGRVPGRATTPLAVGVRGDLPAGRYVESVVLDTNDPDTPTVTAEVEVRVRGAARLDVAPTALEFDGFVGVPVARALTLTNRGERDVAIDALALAAGPGWALDAPAVPLTLPPRAAATVTVRRTAEAPGPAEATLMVASPTPGVPAAVVSLTGVAVAPPVVSVDPGSLAVALPPRAPFKAERTLVVRNAGGSPLSWSLSQTTVPAPATRDPGREDAFGYAWRTEDEAGGPRFDWRDARDDGVALALGDDDVSAAQPLGFAFEFYGTPYEAVHVSSDGWLSFVDAAPRYANAATLPDAGPATPAALIAPFWDDLDPSTAGDVLVARRDGRFVVQWDRVERFAEPGALTFQAILCDDGRIVFQYLAIDGRADSATIGIQNAEATIGNLVSADAPFASAGRAVEFRRAPPWLTIDPSAGTLASGAEATVRLTFDAAALPADRYAADLALRSDDPRRPAVTLPVALNVGEIEPAEIFVPRGGRRDRATVAVHVELPPGYRPGAILPETVRIEGTLAPLDGRVELVDLDRDGVVEARLRFPAAAFRDLVLQSGGRSVTLTGEVRETTWLRGKIVLRTGPSVRPAPRR